MHHCQHLSQGSAPWNDIDNPEYKDFFQVQNHQDWVIFGLVFALQACFKSISRPTRLIKRPMALKVLLYNATPALPIEAMKGRLKAFFINCKQILDKFGLKLMLRNKLRGMRRLMSF